MDLNDALATYTLVTKHIETIKYWGYLVFDKLPQFGIDFENNKIRYMGEYNKKSDLLKDKQKRMEIVESNIKLLLGEPWDVIFEVEYDGNTEHREGASKSIKAKRKRKTDLPKRRR